MCRPALEPLRQRVRGTCCHPRPPPVHELLRIPALPTPGPISAARGGFFPAGRSLASSGSPCRQCCAPPVNQGTPRQRTQHPTSPHTHTDLLLTKLLQFSLGSQLQQGDRNSPAPAKGSPQPTPPGYPAYRCRSSAAAAGSAQAGRRLQPPAQRRGLPEPLQLLPQAGRRDRRKEGAESPAQSQAPSPGAPGLSPAATTGLGGAWVEEWLGYVPLQGLPALLCLRHPFVWGSSFPGSGTHSYLCRCHPRHPSIHYSPDSPRCSECSQHSSISWTLLLPAELQRLDPGTPEIPAFKSGT